MISEHSRETLSQHILHVILLSSPQEARILKPKLRGGNFAITHLVHLGSNASAMTARLMQFDVWLACCSHSREIQQIRQITPRAPLVICSQMEEEVQIVKMLDAGADDYIFFTCGKQELHARLHGHARRYRGIRTSSCEVPRQIGPFLALESKDQRIRLQCAERYVVVRGQIVHLTPIECALLFILMREGGKVLSHQSLLHAVWGEAYHGEVDYIRVYLHTLRLKLEEDSKHPFYLETITGVGYRFRQPCIPTTFHGEASHSEIVGEDRT